MILLYPMARGWGSGRVNCERVDAMFNQELTPPEPRPNLILFDLLHCYKKFIHAAGDHHWSRQNTRLVRTSAQFISIEGSSVRCSFKNRKTGIKTGFAGLAKSLAYCVQKRSSLGFDARGSPPRRTKQSGLDIRK
jgi:hypothetical protein